MVVRPATPEDAPACAAIYAPYVTDTAVSFELEPPDAAEMARRMAAAHAWLVLEDEGEVVGYAYAGTFHPRVAYRWATETSVYLRQGFARRGGGRALYEVLLPLLKARGFTAAIAGMTLPNDGSEGLHRAFGFEPVGTYRRIGWKLGAWHDVAWAQLMLADDDSAPDEQAVQL
ncbi:GNAT family N-acetyltransferase [Solirubrobacter phytolaccae]|uniref:GNAT family N-acetyltransferase n=1 Tax=Solirubrobacter phytolaccae TaxID=1404360 RepID=A0A9X3S9Q2_9ACTN|nr:GNAT family N-acetyltransferase [Solirubrobacter phytolaccae]MDA0182853.1 GNAT family N-acetyltransferase [Solirubrobacter phytolaccae]